MRIAHLSDLHIRDGVRLEDHREVLERVVSNIICTKADLTIIAGDLTGKTVPHRSTPAERRVLYPALVRLASCCPIVVCYGNHDQEPDLDSLVNLGGDFPIHVLKAAGAKQIPTPAGLVNTYWLSYPTKRWMLAGESSKGIAESQRMVQEKLSMLCKLWSARIRRRREQEPTEPHIFIGHANVKGARTSGGEVLAGQEIELSRHDLEAMRVDYGALGHIHLEQEIAERCWYSGNPWRYDFGETEDHKVWHLVEIGDREVGPMDGCDLDEVGQNTYKADDRLPVRLHAVNTECRDFVTLDYRWAAPDGESEPRWTKHPASKIIIGDQVSSGNLIFDSDAAKTAMARCVSGAEVRARLTVPQQWVSSCPWAEELRRIQLLGAHRIIPERVVEPTLRVRAPKLKEAKTIAAKLTEYWKTLGTAPTGQERDIAFGCLTQLETMEDEAITKGMEESA